MKIVFKKFMPVTEICRFLWHQMLSNVRKTSRKDAAPFMPNVGKIFNHLCFHTGGRAVLDEMERLLHLSEQQMAASRATLYRYGNTSSSSVWYELAYHECQSGVKPGHKVWQIAFGSGFKCNSVVWQATDAYHMTVPTTFDKTNPDFRGTSPSRPPTCYLTMKRPGTTIKNVPLTPRKTTTKITRAFAAGSRIV